jgi:hypothetical protein
MLKSHSTLSHASNIKSPSRLFKMASSADLTSPKKKSKKYSTVSVQSSPTKGTNAVWDLEIQTGQDVKAYFTRTKAVDVEIGVVKKAWQLLRNESLTCVQVGQSLT